MPPIPTPPDESLRPEPADPTDDQTEGALGLPDDLPDAPPPPEAAIGRLGRVNRSSQEASNKEARRREAEEDRELILRAQKGDQAAFRRLVERHQRRAFAIAMGLVRDENDARELVQDAFLRVYRNLNSFQGGSSFFTWLYRIVTNLAIDLMRKPGRRDAELVDGQAASDEPTEFPLVSRIDGADPIDVMRRREIAGRIQAALDALPPYHRGVILMREVEGMSYEEMAVAMGVSKGTIMSRLFHARQKLQRALADCYAEEGRSRSGNTDEIAAEPEEAP
ncbi:sigma-70 family RNA polymerase sigma factor [Polyangium sp. y55x31]|uniref:sigma-70 family RNA polymerase sigma factor n=1 Tax=Polyangium sp. y55x31 TaxID=3042688 RepID=UPI0024825CC1|nr:sigma-70 family RNA polymerase sigma factor [Polyangium sp. y55x31]MDI1481940.1 sigma-70 family RNA polymerase sigma factor [Polyangium sp. y55x31]